MCSDPFGSILLRDIQPRQPHPNSRCPTTRSFEEEAGAAAFSCKRNTVQLCNTKPKLVNRRMKQRRGENRHIDEWVRVSHRNQFDRRRQVGDRRRSRECFVGQYGENVGRRHVRTPSLGYKSNRFSSNNEHGTVRVLHHPRRNAPDEKPGDGTQPLGPHHDQIGMFFGGRLHDLFSRVPKVAQGSAVNPASTSFCTLCSSNFCACLLQPGIL